MTDTIMTKVASPVGELTLTATDEGLTGVYFDRGTHPPAQAQVESWHPDDGERGRASEVLAITRDQLAEYFAGERTSFDLPLAPRGTDFQRRVWAQLR